VQQTRVPDVCNYGINSFSAVYFFVNRLIKSPQNLILCTYFLVERGTFHAYGRCKSIGMSSWRKLTKEYQYFIPPSTQHNATNVYYCLVP